MCSFSPMNLKMIVLILFILESLKLMVFAISPLKTALCVFSVIYKQLLRFLVKLSLQFLEV